ncbi:MAG: hypothetical protein JWL96_4660 [Sphingomonas bacterium]|nr:hypothetical protein [Sphingomonas bacterium]
MDGEVPYTDLDYETADEAEPRRSLEVHPSPGSNGCPPGGRSSIRRRSIPAAAAIGGGLVIRFASGSRSTKPRQRRAARVDLTAGRGAVSTLDADSLDGAPSVGRVGLDGGCEVSLRPDCENPAVTDFVTGGFHPVVNLHGVIGKRNTEVV